MKQYRAEGHEGTVFVPAVFGRTATARAKNAMRRTVDRDEAMAASKPSTLRALALLDELAGDLGLVVHQTPGGALLKTPSKGSVANVYLAKWDSLDVDLNAMGSRGWDEAADHVHSAKSAMTTKVLTRKNPNMPSEDAVAQWGRLRPVLTDIANLYLSVE